MSVIIFKNEDGSIAVLIPADEALGLIGLAAIAEKDAPGRPFAIISADDLPGEPQSRWSVPDEALQGGSVGAVIAVAPAPDPPAKTRLYKADIWRRATDAEAGAIDAMLSAQPVRLRRMWSDATFLSTSDGLFTLIQTAATQAFGSSRAAELLQPTE